MSHEEKKEILKLRLLLQTNSGCKNVN